MFYLIFLTTFLITLGVICLFTFKFKSHSKLVVERVLIFLLIAVFVIRYFSYSDIQRGTYNIFAGWQGNMNPFFNAIGELCVWFELTAIIMIFLRPWSNFKTARFYVKFIATPILLVSAISLYPMLNMMQGFTDKWSLLSIFLPIEIGIALALCAYYWYKDYNVKIGRHSYGEVIAFSILINLATIPPFLPTFLFGQGYPTHSPVDFSIYHRLLIYFSVIIIPLAIYFSLRNAHRDKIKYTMVFIAVGTLLNYCCLMKVDDIFVFYRNVSEGVTEQISLNILPWYEGELLFKFVPSGLPLHLCNLAMFLILPCYIFNLKKLFYFTYFINVFGAILAMLMPNTGDGISWLSTSVIHFWINHMCAYMMPLLGVALHLYQRPKLKQYFYSSCFFVLYFVVVFVLNTVNCALGMPTDFFFLSTNYVAEQLGKWAENLWKIAFTFTINGIEFTVRPFYQMLFLIVYFTIGFGVWFVYVLGFDISDNHYELMLKLRGIHQDKLALKSQLNGRSLNEPMEKNVGVVYKLEHFSKKYAFNKIYAVKDANLEVHGGEIFGFLGPNGAGKSTIIKSTVGIQPITEGNINICGYDVKTQPVYAKSLIGFVPDHYALYEKLTGREYLNYIADIYEVSKEDRDARLSNYIKIFELESSIDNKIKTYSHGMKQKITIMAALVHNPKVWILDEPLTGLDPTSIYQVKECMRQHASEGNIVFFSSHIIDIVEKLCDRIAIIKKGQIQCVKTVKEIEESGMTLEDFYLETIVDPEAEEKLEELKGNVQ